MQYGPKYCSWGHMFQPAVLLCFFCGGFQCARINEAAQSHQQVEEVDQDSRGTHQAAAEVFSH